MRLLRSTGPGKWRQLRRYTCAHQTWLSPRTWGSLRDGKRTRMPWDQIRFTNDSNVCELPFTEIPQYVIASREATMLTQAHVTYVTQGTTTMDRWSGCCADAARGRSNQAATVFRFQNVSGGLRHLESEGRIVCSVSHSNGLVIVCIVLRQPFRWRSIALRGQLFPDHALVYCVMLFQGLAERNRFTVKYCKAVTHPSICHELVSDPSNPHTASKADECPLGALTAAVMDLICASNCRPDAWHADHMQQFPAVFRWGHCSVWPCHAVPRNTP